MKTLLIYPFFSKGTLLTHIGEHPQWELGIDFIVKIGLSVLAGLLIGIEREYKGKAAGLKTNMLVSLGACVFVSLSLHFQGGNYIDLTRVLSQVIIGVGFLGGGVILKRKGSIEGLTTAATVWCSAAAGCIAAMYLVGNLIIFTAMVVTINIIFGFIDSKIKSRESKNYDGETKDDDPGKTM